jgi:hypothetical protein
MNNRNLNPDKRGFLGEMILQARLVIRLLKDSRINPLLKLLPFASLVYVVFPEMLLGPVDDAAVVLFGSYLFLELCPQQIVQEHMRALRGEIGPGDEPVDVVDAEFNDLDE